jgi:hypothetical protein
MAGTPMKEDFMRKKVILIFLWISSCIIFLLVGYIIRKPQKEMENPKKYDSQENKQVTVKKSKKPGTATAIFLPDDNLFNFFTLKSEKDPNLGATICRQENEPKNITGLVISNKGFEKEAGPVLYVGFYKESGLVKSLEVREGSRHLREWGFREDTSLEYETKFNENNEGTKQYFDKEGNPTRSEKFIIHHGS